jgi:hypothetical protein
MPTTLEFLERIGQEAQLRHAGNEALAHAMADAGLESESYAALLTRSQSALERLLGATANVCCAVGPPCDGEPEIEGLTTAHRFPAYARASARTAVN